MSSSEWFQRVVSFFSSGVTSEGEGSIASKVRHRLELDRLEDRLAPATFVVTTLTDTGAGSLRDAITQAETTVEADTITFQKNLTGTIQLKTSGDSTAGDSALLVNSQITIDGNNGSDGIQIHRDDAAPNMRLFHVGTLGNLTLQGVTLSNGAALEASSITASIGSGKGGAIFNQGTLTILNSTLMDNLAQGKQAKAATTVTTTTTTGTATTGTAATGSSIGDSSSTGSTGSTVASAPEDGEGGAIYNEQGSVTITNSTLTANRAVAGTALKVSDSTTAKGLGGGVFNHNGRLTIQSSTITKNIALQGGRGVYNFGDGATATATVNSTIIGQDDTDVSDFVGNSGNGGTTITRGNNNLIRISSGFGGGINSKSDPKLGALANNGGPTETILPEVGSPAIDAGGDSPGLTTDQRGTGFPRISNKVIDIGSVETQVAAESVNIVTGSGPGTPAHVKLMGSDGSTKLSFFAYDPSFTGGVNVALGDVNGDGVKDIITAPMSKGGPNIKVFDGKTGAEIRSFYAYDPVIDTGVNIASGDVNGDGFDDIITAPAHGVAHVRVFDGKTGKDIVNLYAYDPSFTGGASVASADMNKDGFADIITGAGSGGGPHVRVINGHTLDQLNSFYVVDPSFTGGVNVATGDLNGDGVQDIIASLKETTGIIVTYDGKTRAKTHAFEALGTPEGKGVSLAVRDVNGDGKDDILVGAPAGIPSHVRILDGETLQLINFLVPYSLDISTGVSVG